jgi:RNA polymerase sigma-70 factor (ECF subfamily)
MTSTPASLLDRLAQGADRLAWDRFVELYTPLLVAWCRQLGMSDLDAADLTQDVFVVLVEHLPRFRYDPNQSFRAWLKTVLLNQWRKQQRKLRRVGPMVADPDLLPGPESDRLLEKEEHHAYLIRRAVALMQQDFEPATWKACWEFVVNDRPAADVAAQLGMTVNAVYLAKSRVLRALRTELRGFLD